MGALTRALDWAATPLGPPEGWPPGLRTAVRLVLNTRHPMFLWWGPELIQLYNDAYRRTMGPERHPSALGQPGRACWAEIWDTIGPQIAFVMAGRGATWQEDQLVPVTRHGRREDVWWTYGYSPIDDNTQPSGVGGVLVVCHDITTEHLAREALQASEARLRLALGATEERLQLALDAAQVGTWDWDIPNHLISADAQLARMFGIDPCRAAAGLPFEEYLRVIHLEDRARTEAAILQAMDTGGAYQVEHRLVRPDGSVLWIGARGAGRLDRHGTPVRFIGAAVDITERKRTEAALRASEARWHGLFERMHEGFLLAEPIRNADGVMVDYRYIELNAAFERLTGIPRDRALGRTLREVFPGIEPTWMEVCARVVETGEPANYLGLGAVPGRWFEVYVWRPEPGRFASLFIDVTERKAAEERQALLVREVDHRAKNVLAVVQAALRLTRADDVPTFVRAVEGRVGALARAQTILADHRWLGADLRALLRGELALFLGDAGQQAGGPFARLEGPAVALPAGLAQPLAIVVHELATNAVKYGALSLPAGRVSVSWRLAAEAGSAPLLRLRWVEAGGPQVAGPPAHRGFGSRMLDATVRRQLGGRMSESWEALGFGCEIELRLRPPPEPEAAPRGSVTVAV